jgi:CheY-like chemotaxis protein
MPRILLIEDDPNRISVFREWTNETEFVLIEASSGGRCMGILRKGMTEGIAGILLDHDLEKQPVTATDLLISGTQLLRSISLSIPRSVPILIHSMNSEKPPAMERTLKNEGFSVTRIGMASLTCERYNQWLEEVRDNQPFNDY